MQANLIGVVEDDPALVDHWRGHLIEQRRLGERAGAALSLSQSSPDYRRLWGAPDDQAWERAHEHYLAAFEQFSDIQDQRPAAAARAGGAHAAADAARGIVLMTIDAVGGVWRYALDLARGLAEHGVGRPVLGFGPPPDAAQRREAEAAGALVWTDLPLDWMVDERRRAGGRARARIADAAARRRGRSASS